MQTEILILGAIIATGIFWIGAAGLAYQFKRDMNNQKEQAASRLAKIEQQKTALKKVVYTIIDLVTGYCPNLDLDLPDNGSLFEVYDLDGVPERVFNGRIYGKEQYVFAMALKHLDGWCSYRKLYETAGPFNETMKKSGQHKIALSQHFIRDTLEKYTFDHERSGPIIAVWHGDTIDSMRFYILTYDIDQSGNETRKLIPLAEILGQWQLRNDADRLIKGASNPVLECDTAVFTELPLVE